MTTRRFQSRDEAYAFIHMKFSKNFYVYEIMCQFSYRHKVPLRQLYENIVWPLIERTGCAYEGLKQAVNGGNVIEGLSVGEVSDDRDTVILTERLWKYMNMRILTSPLRELHS